jgi:hypothetical protein
MSPTAAPTGLTTLNLNATAGNETLNIQNTSSGVFTGVNTGNSANSTINIGNTFGTLAGINGGIDISSLGIVNINDANDTTHATATLDNASGNVVFPFEVTGLSNASIAYGSGISALNINSGISSVTAGVTFNINNTPTGTTTTLNGNGNQNFFNLSNSVEANGLNNLLGAIVIHGGPNSSSALTVNDSNATASSNYTVTSTTVTRANFGGLTYDNIGSLTLDTQNTLASGSNTVTINGTANNVNTTINSFGIGDTISLNSTGSNGTVALNTQTPGSTLNIIACSSPVSVDMNASGTVNIGSTGGNGTMSGIQAAVFLINGPSFFDFNLHDENDSTAQTWTLNNNDGGNTANIGLSSGSIINYRPGDLNVLNVNGGSGGNNFNINQTSGQFNTTLNTGTGSDTTNVLSTGANTLTINGQASSDNLNLGNNGSTQGLAGTISVTNASAVTAVNIDDSQDVTARTIAFSDDGTTATVTGISPAALHLHDAGIASLTLNGGSGGNTFTVTSTPTLFTTTLNAGSGTDTVNVIATSGSTLNINGQGGADIVTLGANGTLQSLASNIDITNAGGNTTLNLDNSADTTPRTTSISDDGANTTITGLSPAAIAYADNGISVVNLSTAATADTVTVNSTGADATLNITTGAVVGNTLNIIACSAPINVTSNANATVNIGSTGGNGTMTGIQGAIFVHNPHSFTDLNLHDENDTTNETWTLNDNDGLDTANISMSGTAPITYVPGDTASVTVNSGSHVDTFNVNNTSADYTTTINTNNVFSTDIVNVFATGNNTLNITGIQDFNAVNLGGLAGVGMQNLHGTINVTNPNAQTTLSLDDSQDATGRTTSVSDDGTTGTITGLSPATINYAINNVRTVNITTGSGNDTATVNSNFVDLSFNDAGGSNTLTIDSQRTKPTIVAGSNSHQIVVSATESNGFLFLHPVTIQGYSNVNLTDLPITIIPGSAQTTTSVVHTGFTNSTVADFTVNLPLIGSNATGLPIGDFSSGVSWGDGTSDSAGTFIQDPNNPDHYFIDSSHTFNAIGAFSVAASAVFTPPAGVTSLSTTLNGVNINLPLSNASKTANVTALSTTPNTSVFSPGPAKTATAGKLLNKIVIQLKTPQNKLDKTDNSSVTLSIASGPGNFANGSITTVNAVKGKATFSHLQLNTAGVYTITESNGEKTITSQSFTVAPSKVASLTITPSPVGPTTTTPLAFTVHAFDAFGNLVSKAPVKISVTSGPPHAKIVGTVTLKTTAGVAAFSNLFLHTPGSYVLKASSGPIFTTTSEFDIT